MTFPTALEHRRKVEEFQQRHRVGLLTLLFTDMVGSTKLKQDLGDLIAVELIHRHHALVRELLGGFSAAEEIGTAGDSFLIVFTKPSDAARFSLLLQAKLRILSETAPLPIVDRIGIHIGEVVIEEKGDEISDLYGIQVDTAARVMSLAEAGQILLTRSAFDNARQVIKGQDIQGVKTLSWLNFGPFLLKGVEDPIEICEVGEDGLAPLAMPKDSEKAHRQVSADAEPVLGWRPAIGQCVPNTKWILEKELGEGGFGEVWFARHETLGERRVFKFCFRADRVRSLKRELTLFKLLKERVGHHPNIVGVQDVFLDAPPFYLVMDYDEAQDLRAWCASQGGPAKVPFGDRLEIIAQICDALVAAHTTGILHRDIKPSNILVGRDHDGKLRARLTDFGIGKIVSQEALSAIGGLGFTETLMGTGSGSQTGSQLYMAPELLAGKPASTRSDLYSLGVVLFQLTVGDTSRPVTTDWAEAIADPLLQSDLKNCFAGNPELRFESAGELAKQLRGLPARRAERERHQTILAARERAAYRRGIMRAASLAGIIVTLVAGLALFAWQQSAEARKLAAVNERAALENLRIAAQSKEHLADQYVTKAAELMDYGDYSGALLWSVHALKLEDRKPDKELAHRVRIGSLLREIPTLQQMLFPGGPVVGLRFADSDIVAVGIGSGDDSSNRLPMAVSLWNWKTGTSQAAFGTNEMVFKLDSRAGRLIGLGATDKPESNHLFDFKTRAALSAPLGDLSPAPENLSWTIGGNRSLAIGFREFAFDLWDLGLKRSIQSAGMSSPIRAAAITAETGRYALGFYDGFVGIYNIADPERKAVGYNQGGELLSMEFSPSGLRLLTLTKNGAIQVHELDGASSPRIELDAAISIRYSVGEDQFGAGTETGVAAVWDRATADRLTPLLRHRGPIRTLDFSPDGAFLATGSDDEMIRIWNLATPRQTRVRIKTNDDAQRAGFKLENQEPETTDSGQAPWQALCCKGRLVEVRPTDIRNVQAFDPAQTNRAISTPIGLASRLIKVALSSNEVWIALASINRTVRVWDWRKGQPLTPELKIPEEIIGLEFASDNSALFVQLQDGGGESISLRPSEEPIQRLMDIAELYAGQIVNTNVGLTALTIKDFQARWGSVKPVGTADDSLARILEWREKEASEYETNEMYAQALPQLHSLRLARPKDIGVMLRRGWCLAELDRFAEAEKEFVKLPDLGSRPGEALPLAALACLRQGRNDAFQEIIARLLVKIRAGQLNDSETGLAVWTACLGLRDHAAASEWLSIVTTVAARHPDDPRLGSAWAFAELRAGHPQAAFDRLEIWRKKVTFAESVQLVWIQAMAQLQLKNKGLAEDKIDDLRAHRPSHGSWDYASELQIMLEETRQAMPEVDPF